MHVSNSDLANEAFWRSLFPHMTIGGAGMPPIAVLQADDRSIAPARDLLVREGYLYLPGTQDANAIAGLASVVQRLVAASLPPVFSLIYDQAWAPFLRLHQVIERLFGAPYAVLPDFWAWHIDPKRAESGWRPHRDKGSFALFPDRTPKSLTVWVPLTESTPLNGCMYMVPADRDPTYGTGDDHEWRFQYGDIRALPANPGDSFIWNQAVLHWGAHASERAPNPRMSIAMEFQRQDVDPFNTPLLAPLTLPNFRDRLALIGKQILQYKHMYPLSAAMEAVAADFVVGGRAKQRDASHVG